MKKTSLYLKIALLLALQGFASLAAAGLNLGSTPLYLGASVQPIVMLTMPKDIQIYQRAYNDFSDLDGDGVVDSEYKHSITYYGYYDSAKCYTYDSTNNWFSPAATQPAQTTTNAYCNPSGTTNQWSGNFLNWATMTRIDVIRKVLYGGLRVVDSQTNTVLERTIIPTDANAFAKYYDGNNGTTANDIALLTPFSLSSTPNTYSFAGVGNSISSITFSTNTIHTADTSSGLTIRCSGCGSSNDARFTPGNLALYSVGTQITVSGATGTCGTQSCAAVFNGTFTVTSIDSSNRVHYNAIFSVTSLQTPGGTISISVASTSAVANVTSTGSNLSAGATVTVAGATPTVYNGTFTVLSPPVPTANTFSYALPSTPTANATNAGITFTSNALSTVMVRAITSITHGCTGSSAPFTCTTTATVTSANHGFSSGNKVVISGASQLVDNGAFTISGVTATTFQYTVSAAPTNDSTTASAALTSYTINLTNSGKTRNIIKGDQVQISAGMTAPTTVAAPGTSAAATAPAATVTGVVTSASSTSITITLAGSINAVGGGSTGGCTGNTSPCSSGIIASGTVTNLSSNGITICNVNYPSGTVNSETLNTSSGQPPLMRVVAGNFGLWDTLNARDCVWSGESGADTSSGNGNAAFYSELSSSVFPPAQTATGSGGVALVDSSGGLSTGQYAVRAQVCVTGLLGNEKCQNYPGNPATSGGTWKPTGLLQDYASGNNRKIKFGLFSGSFSKNLSGGVLRKNAGFLDTVSPVGTTAPASGDEIDTRDGTFLSKFSTTTGQFSGGSGIIQTLNNLRVFGYSFSSGNYSADSDGCGSPGLLANVLPSSVTGASTFSQGQCASWGNPISEIYSETLRYLAGKSANSAFTPTAPAAGVFSSGGLTDDGILGLQVQGWQDPMSSANYCAPMNVVVFNSSVNTYDSDQVDISQLAGGPSAAVQTGVVGAGEGITNTSQFLIGDNGAGNQTFTCTPKTFSGTNGLGSVTGICPESPIGLGTYLMAGAAYYAHINRVRTDLTLPATDITSLKVKTYGVALNTATPTISIPVPGTGALANPVNSVPARFVTILPTGKTLNSGSYRGPGTITNFKVVRQNLAAGTGKFFVSWEDSQQGNDHELDQWGYISYQFVNGNTQIQVTTQVVFASAGFSLGFGFIIAGTNPSGTTAGASSDGEHFLSAHHGDTTFNFTAADGTVECTSCQEADGARSRTFNLATSGGATVLQPPLFYTAKYGGFTDLNNNNLPDQTGEWDNLTTTGSAGSDGIPDNYFPVTNPTLLQAAMDRAFIYILQVSSASSVATNSTSLNTGSVVYQARFNSNEWSGQLLSFSIDVNGVIDQTPQWDSGQLTLISFNSAGPSVTRANNRVMITYNPGATAGTAATSRGIPFRWTNLTTAQQTFLDTDGGSGIVDTAGTLCTANNVPAGCTVRGSLRLSWMRGDQSNEGATSGSFRVRPTTVLGDIVNSTPRFVGPPSGAFTDPNYTAFKAGLANRTPILYVGGNDAMMHAFDATSGATGGDELLAYVPKRMYSGFTQLTAKNYSHKYYVDGSPSVADACLGACASSSDWRTVLVEGYNAGGKGYTALDVSNPTQWTEANAANIVLWEFTNENDPDVGFSYSKPQIVKLNNGKWAAIFGNGYNSTVPGSSPSTEGAAEVACTSGNGLGVPYAPTGCSASYTGYAYLYIVYLDPPAGGTWVQGVNFFKISTNTGTNVTTPTAFTVASPNGLSSPLTVDSNADGLVDFVYAGDLVGNLWKFDLTSASPTSWGVSGGAPLFTAVDASGNRQPITTAPVTSPNSAGGIMVMFGTGKYLEQGDDTGPYSPTNSFYGIWDQLNGTTVTRSQLMVQQVLNVSAGNPTGALSVTSGGTTNSVILTSAFVPNYTTATRTNGTGTFGDPNANPNAVDLTATTPPQLGWVLDFPNSADGGPPNNVTPGTGEKVAFDPLVSTGKVVVTTLIPSNIPCLAGGTSFIMDMDPTSGSRLTQSPFDLNGDKAFSTGDFVTYGGVQVAVTGLGSTIGIVPQPTVIQAGTGKEIKVLSGSSGGLMSVLENALGSNTTAGSRGGQRVSWREMLSD